MNHLIHPETEIGHVHLMVSDLSRSVQFYREMIGFNILHQDHKMVTLTADGITPLLVLEEQVNAIPKPANTTGLYHFAILLPDRSSLANWLVHIVQKRYPLHGASDHLFSEAIYLADPDNNGIEIYADRPRERWERTENGEYKGVTEPLDVEDLLAEADHQPWGGLPDKTRIGHVHLHVSNIQEAYKFYCDALGFESTMRMGNHALFVSAGGYHHHLGLNTWAGVGAPMPPLNAVGMRLFTILLPNQDEVERVAERLKNMGISVIDEQETVFVKDPSGNTIQLKRKYTCKSQINDC
jgi:catechol 2,3-dioxygenase